MLDSLYHSINPVAIALGPIVIRWYALAYLAGFVCAGFMIYRVARCWKLDLSIDDIVLTVTYVIFGVIIFGRLFYVLFYGAGYYLEHPLDIIMINQGGMSFHGGFFGALVGGCLACKTTGISCATMADLAVIGAPLGLFFGRCANFINGELWGKPSNLPWAVTFETGGGIPRHPSQLYEALLEGLLLFIVLYALSRESKPARPQLSFLGTFMALYGFFRFLVEFVRVPDEQLGYLFGPITMGQLLSVPLIIIGIGLLVYALKAQRPQVGYLHPEKSSYAREEARRQK